MRPLPNNPPTVTETDSLPRRDRDVVESGRGVETGRGAVESDRAVDSVDDRPVLESRRRRLTAYLRHNAERICRDTAVLATWALLMTIWIQGAGVPRWLCYLVTFAGVVGYTRLTAPWSRPYRSPDDLESLPTSPR